jgi:hypothetical protein
LKQVLSNMVRFALLFVLISFLNTLSYIIWINRVAHHDGALAHTIVRNWQISRPMCAILLSYAYIAELQWSSGWEGFGPQLTFNPIGLKKLSFRKQKECWNNFMGVLKVICQKAPNPLRSPSLIGYVRFCL